MSKEITCPNCGNKDLETIMWAEWVPVWRPLLELKDGRLLVEPNEQMAPGWWESGKDEGLFCKACCSDFKIPDGVTIDHDRAAPKSGEIRS